VQLATVEVPLEKLTPHPQNPRQGDVGALMESIRQHGFFNVVGAQTSTGYIIYGNHRYLAAQMINRAIIGLEPDWLEWSIKWETDLSTLPTVYLDVDDEEALRLLLVDNRVSDLATYDDGALVALLTDLAQTTELALEGTGYDPEDLDGLISRLTPLDLSDPTPPAPTDAWEVIRLVVPPDLHKRFYKVLESMPGNDEVRRLRELVKRASR